MQIANKAYLQLMAERYLELELERTWNELNEVAGRFVDGGDPSHTRRDFVPASGCEPAVNVFVHYFPQADASIAVQVVVGNAECGANAIILEGIVKP